ncbi:cupredoxin family protein [Mesorhizobium sp. B2-6-2]|uniref:cupredoxin domain-containing protein n=1 Tax=Mesorhizobium sp. B2-6-2 TaxID=2589915 RepID=UPI00112E4A58|nr:cupredoxin family protein [Mesorhizobium sp. B2-6-2]TPJ77149.1 copper oxidase [Mesorhizobium sp. B2-6-2]
MKRMMIAAAAFSLLATPVFASGTGEHKHVGMPGKANDATRDVTIEMMEMSDGSMMFEPASLDVKAGETVRLKLKNDGEIDHEFVIDTDEGIQEHKAMMAKMPDMQHDEPNAMRLKPGASGEIIWTFTTPGSFEFACLIPGHYENGMKGAITVSN